jgi:serine/threonine protein kinase/tetratricopeptide (TPR) repeat protein
MGVVYRATDRLLQRQVAVKRVLAKTVVAGRQSEVWSHRQTTALAVAPTPPKQPPLNSSHGDYTDANDLALANEFRFLASLRHPNIVSVLDFGFDEETHPYYGMDWLPNARTIFDVSRERNAGQRIGLIVQVLHALVYLHRQGIFHCDLKPGNILVTPEDSVKVLDFGIAEYRGGLDRAGLISGSVAYMAPEVLEGARPGEASDLYSLGTVMYEVFAGQHPFVGGDRDTMIRRVLVETPDYQPLVTAGVDDRLIDVVRRLLSKASYQRPRAADVLTTLADIVGRSDVMETVETRESLLQSARFVGRESQLAQLLAAWRDTCRHGKLQLWLVGGESGVGKSRLTDELRIHALVSGALVMRGQAVDRGAASHQLWREIARYLALRGDLTPFDESVLKAIVPDIAALVDHPVPDTPELEAQASEERLKRLIVTLLTRYERPTLLILEDLQWAGNVNLSLLQRVTEDISNRPIMIVANYRSEEVPYLKDLFPYAHHIQLERFAKDELVALARSVIGETATGQAASLVETLYLETAGNAFFAVEALRSLAQQAGSLDNVGRVPVSREVLGGSLDSLIRFKLKRIPAPLQRPLQLAAIQGRVIDVAVLEAAAAAEHDIALLLSVALAQGILAPHEHTYRFAHDKIREGLIASIEPAAVPGLHEQIATAIERVHANTIGEHAAALALHWRDAGTRPHQERHFAGIAGRQFLERGSYKEAIAHLTRALDLYGVTPDRTAPIAELERALGEAYFSDGQMEEARASLAKSAGLLRAAVPKTPSGMVAGLVKEVLVQIAHRMLPAALYKRNNDEARKALLASLCYERLSHIIFFENRTVPLLYASMRCLNLAETAPPSPELARAYGTICYSIGLVPQYPLAHFYERKCLAVADLLHKQGLPAEPWVWEITAYFYSSKGEFATSVERYQKGAEQAMSIGYLSRWLECSTLLWMDYYRMGLFDKARELREITHAHAIQTGNEHAMGWAFLGIAEHALLRGALDEADEFLDKTGRVTQRLGYTERAWMHGLAARLHTMRGNYPAMKQAAASALALLKEVPLPNAFYTQEGYTATAEAFLTMAEHPERPGAGGSTIAADTKLAMKRLRAFAKVFPASRPHVYRVEGWYAWQQGRQDEARQHWARAIKEADRFNKIFEKALAHYDIGRFDANGAGHLKQAHEIFERLGFEYYERQTRALMDR